MRRFFRTEYDNDGAASLRSGARLIGVVSTISDPCRGGLTSKIVFLVSTTQNRRIAEIIPDLYDHEIEQQIEP